MTDRWYASEPRNGLTRADVQHEIRDFVQSQSLRGSMVPRSIPQISVDVPVVTALPLGAQDGSEVYFIADSDNGVLWHLRYRRSGSADYPWEYVGGPPLYAEVQTSEGTASATYAALATAGPSITTPVAGDYDVALGAQASNSTVGAVAHMSYDIGSTAAVDADGPRSTSSTAGADIAIAYMRRKSALAAVALTAKYKQTAGGTATFARRWMSVTPVRVGRA